MPYDIEYSWLYVAHESQLPRPGDFLSLSLAQQRQTAQANGSLQELGNRHALIRSLDSAPSPGSWQPFVLFVYPNLCLTRGRNSLRIIRLESS